MTVSKALCASSAQAAESFLVASRARISLRQVGTGDRDGLAALFARLTPESRYQRFLSPKRELTPRELTFFTDIDHLNHEAIAAVDERDDSIVGVARYVRDADRPDVAELAIEVADAFQRMGIGTALTSLTIHHAHAKGWRFLTATTLWENRAARGCCETTDFVRAGAAAAKSSTNSSSNSPAPTKRTRARKPASGCARSQRPLSVIDGGTTTPA